MPKVKLTESPFIKYTVQDAPGFEKFNEKFLPVITEALNSIHINFSVTENELSLFIPASYYNEYHKRNAGRRRKIMSKTGEYETYELNGHTKTFYSGEKLMYSDVLPLILTKGDAEIIRELKIPRATYYRHKKQLLESRYYQSIDKEHLSKEFALSPDSAEYYKSLPSDFSF